MSSLDLSGKVALVTGGARGIGLSISKVLAEHGASVVVGARSIDKAQEAVDLLSVAGDARHSAIALDVCDIDAIKSSARHIHKIYKKLDILVNNAGVLGDGLLGMIPDDIITETLSTNIVGPIQLIQNFSRLLSRAENASVINLSSIIGTNGNKGQVVYSASKSAVIGITLSAAKEMGPKGIRVNAIAPGYIATDMIAHLEPKVHEERLNSIVMGRVGEPIEVANLALFLASDLSCYVTGQVIGVDGGMVI